MIENTTTSHGDTEAALPPATCSACLGVLSKAEEYGTAGLHLEFQPHGYPYPIVLPVITRGSRAEAKAWSWNGSTDKPTLKPSIKTTHPNGAISHIWLTDGMCQHLSDSTDGLAGKVLPLVPMTPGFRLLEVGETYEVGDESFHEGKWVQVADGFAGFPHAPICQPTRRPQPNTKPSDADPTQPPKNQTK